jgi:ATP-dependent RNA helicase DeaD
MQRFLPLARSLGQEDEEHSEGTGLLAMLLDDFYQETFHAPLVPPASEETGSAQRRSRKPKRPRSDSRDQRRGGASRRPKEITRSRG